VISRCWIPYAKKLRDKRLKKAQRDMAASLKTGKGKKKGKKKAKKAAAPAPVAGASAKDLLKNKVKSALGVNPTESAPAEAE